MSGEPREISFVGGWMSYFIQINVIVIIIGISRYR